VEDLIDAARKSPGKLSFSSTGFGAQNHLLGELFCQKTGIVLNHIPFSGGSAYITALLGGHIDISIASAATFGSHIMPGGGLRTLVVFDQKRVPDLPDVPTAIERGIDITLTSWFGLQAPKGLPKEVRSILVQAFKDTVEDPQTISMLNKLVGINNIYLSPEEVDKKIQTQYKLFQDICKRIGLTK
jgi:tripartite-type tricarboxylate transporter receptor subunit TctC